MKKLRSRVSHLSATTILTLMVSFAWVIYNALLWKNMLRFEKGSLYAGHPYVWADWSMHLGLIANFVHKPVSLWFVSHPFFAGYPLNYPFVTNLISAVLQRVGVSLPLSLTLPSFVLCIALLVCILVYTRTVFHSRIAALISAVLFFGSGGLGIFLIALQERSLSFLSQTVASFTQLESQGITFTNIFMGMLVPQRAFLLGLPLGLLVLTVISQQFLHKHPRVTFLVGAGVLAGLMPIIHTHTFLILIMMSAWLFVCDMRHWKQWLWYAVPAAIISFLTYRLFLASSVSASQFFSLKLGWMAQPGLLNWVRFWMLNWGVFWIAALVSTISLWHTKRRLFLITMGWWLIFVVSNIILFQPQTWDNSKMFAWGYLGLAGTVAWGVERLLHHGVKGKVIAIVLILSMTLSGFVDMFHMLDTKTKSFEMLSAPAITMGRVVAKETPPDSVFLTADWVTNPVAMIGGRNVIMGYNGWVFSYGFPYQERERDIRLLYAGQQVDELIEKYGITHILVGPEEARFVPNVAFFTKKFPKMYEQDGYAIYTVE